jgi:hypothetical protein
VYRLKPNIKRDPQRRWSLPDRIFFAHGACHILAGVYLDDPPLAGFYAERIITGDGFAGSHIFVTDGVLAFDFHGYSSRARLLKHHTSMWAGDYEEGWNCALERVHFDLLCKMELNCRKMLGPDQYYGDPISRSKTFINKINHVEAALKVVRRLGEGVPALGSRWLIASR